MGSTKALTRGRGGDCGGGRGGVSGPREGHEVPVLVREGEGLRHGDRGQVQVESVSDGLVLVNDAVRQDICHIFDDINGVKAICSRNRQCIPSADVTENPGEDDNLSILIANSRAVAHVNTSSVCHTLEQNISNLHYIHTIHV